MRLSTKSFLTLNPKGMEKKIKLSSQGSEDSKYPRNESLITVDYKYKEIVVLLSCSAKRSSLCSSSVFILKKWAGTLSVKEGDNSILICIQIHYIHSTSKSIDFF